MSDISERKGVTRQSLLRGGLAMALAGSAAITSGPAFGEQSGAAENSQAAPSDYRSGTRIVLLGTAGGPPLRKFRSQPANLLIVNGAPYMVDIGYGAMHQLLFTGHRPVDVSGVFITHHHWDHDADLAALIGFNWVEGRQSPLPIHGPYGTKQMVEGALDYFMVPERIFAAPMKNAHLASEFVQAHEVLKDGEFYRDNNVVVTAAENTHYQTFDAGKDKPFSYRFDTPHRSIVFTGDTGYSDAVIELAKGADVFVSEVIDADAAVKLAVGDSHLAESALAGVKAHMWKEHLPPENVGKMAAKAGVKMVVLTHFAPGLDSESDAERYTAAVRQFYSGPVIAGRDLLEI